MIVEEPSAETAVKVQYICDHQDITRWHLMSQVTYKEDCPTRVICSECVKLNAAGIVTTATQQIKKAIMLD